MKRKMSAFVLQSGPLFTVAQAACAWGMSEGALRRRIQSGMIEAIKVSTPRKTVALFIEAATVHALLAARWCPKELDRREVRSR